MVATGPPGSHLKGELTMLLTLAVFRLQCSRLQWFNQSFNHSSLEHWDWYKWVEPLGTPRQCLIEHFSQAFTAGAGWLNSFKCGWIKLQKVRHEVPRVSTSLLLQGENCWVELVHRIISIILFAFLFYPFLQFMPIHFPETLLSNQLNQSHLGNTQLDPIGTSCHKEDGGRPHLTWPRYIMLTVRDVKLSVPCFLCLAEWPEADGTVRHDCALKQPHQRAYCFDRILEGMDNRRSEEK